MKLNDFDIAGQCFYGNDHHYYYPHPINGQWDVIKSPSPRGRWNTANLSLAVVSDLRVANLLAKTMSQLEKV
jgi:hypothetical protein